MKKKTLFVINSLGCGGAEKSLISLLSLFDFEKYDVDLQMFNPTGMFLKLLPMQVHVLDCIPYFSFCSNKTNFHFTYQLTRLRISVSLRSNAIFHGHALHDAQVFWKYAAPVIDSLPQKYDVAIAWGQGNPTHFVAEKVTASKKIAFINVDYLAAGYNREFDHPYYCKFQSIVAVSDKLQGLLSNVFPDLTERLTTIYDIRNQNLIETMAEEFNPYSALPKMIRLVTVGRAVKSKGYDLAITAAKLLKSQGISFQWFFIGDGPEIPAICSQIKKDALSDTVFPIGAKENPYPYIKNADIYVQTSRFEGFCLTLAEARALHIPPVSTNFDAVHNQLQNEKNGLIVEMKPTAIAEGIIRLIQDPILYHKIKTQLENEHIGNENELNKLISLFK